MKINENTIFDIASISKLFTAILLSDSIANSQVELDNPISRFIPLKSDINNENKNITLKQLAIHTSGLPRLPDTQTESWQDFYSSYDSSKVVEFLSLYSVPESPIYFYSNYGYTLLGYVLGIINQEPLNITVYEKILKDLGMVNTTVTKMNNDIDNVAIGTRNGQELQSLPWKAQLGAGGYRSSASDLLSFLSFNLGIQESVPDYIEFTHESLYNITGDFVGQQSQQGLGWRIVKCPGTKVIWHDGATDGFRSFIGFEPFKKWGVVVLSNSETNVGHIGFHLLNNETFNMRNFNLNSQYIENVDEILGFYNFSKNYNITISKTGNQVFAQINKDPKLKIYPESDSKYFFTEQYAYLEFKKNENLVNEIFFYANYYGNEITLRYCPSNTALVGNKIS